jgi:hypothetical protein
MKVDDDDVDDSDGGVSEEPQLSTCRQIATIDKNTVDQKRVDKAGEGSEVDIASRRANRQATAASEGDDEGDIIVRHR